MIKNIKLNLFILFIFFFFSIGCFSNNSETIFSEANNFYKEGKFEQAFDLYKRIKNKTTNVYYNLGNSAYKLSKFGYALLYWRKAEKNWSIFSRQELLENIYLLKNKIKCVDETKRSNFIKRVVFFRNYVTSLIRTAPLIFFQLFFLFAWLFLLAYSKYLYKKKHKMTMVFLFVLLAFSGILLVFRYSFDFRKYGVVVEKKVELLSGPGKSFQLLGFIPEGREVIIQKTSDDFCKVKFSNQIGWIKVNFVEKI